MKAEKLLEEIFEAERAIRAAEENILRENPNQLSRILKSAVDEAKRLTDPLEAELRLYRLADLCAQVPGPAMADALIDILDEDNPAIRAEAADALLDVGYHRYAEVARAIERALDSGRAGPVMEELPFFLAEIAEPSALPLLSRFLEHPKKEIVAAAIEAISELGDPGGIDLLGDFTNDPREVFIDRDEDESMKGTIGELAREAIEALGGELE